MSFRLYLVPLILTDLGNGLTRYDPKYFRDPPNFGSFPLGPHVFRSYGFQPVAIIGANLSAANDTFLSSQSDVFAFPFDLDPQLTAGQVNTVSTALEARFVPANWITAAMNWRAVARTCLAMFQFMGALQNHLPQIILLNGTTNKTLNTQWNALPTNVQNAIRSTAAQLNYSSSFIANNTQMRAILKNFADQWGVRPIILAAGPGSDGTGDFNVTI